MARKGQGWQSFQIRSSLLNGLVYEARKQRRSASNLAEHLLLQTGGIKMMTDEELSLKLKTDNKEEDNDLDD